MDWVERLLIGLIGVALMFILAVSVGLGVAIYRDAERPTFDLKKDEWACTKSHVETTTTMIMVGNVLIPNTSTTTVCDQWSRK